MKQFLFVVTSLLILSSATYGQSKWWVSSDSVNIFTRNTGGVMIGGVEPLGKLTVGGDRLGFNLALVGDYNNLTKNYLKIGVLGRASNGLDGHTLFDLYHSNGTLKKAGFNFRINEKSAFFINGEGNIGIGTEKPMAGLDITSGPDWGGFKKGLRLSANNAISVESGEMKYGMVGSENALHFFATNGGEKVNPFGSAFAKLMSLQPKKVVIEGDLEVKGKIIYEGGQFTGGGSTTGGSNTGGSSTGTGTSDDGGKNDGVTGGGGFVEGGINNQDSTWHCSPGNSIFHNNYDIGIGTSTPGAKLEINGGPLWPDYNTFKKSLTLNSDNSIHFKTQATHSTHFGIIGNSSTKKLEFFRPKWWPADGSWVLQSIMTLDSNGNINFPCTTGVKLSMNSNAYFDIEATNAGGAIRFATAGSNPTNTRLYIAPSGNVGIGTTNPVVKLDLDTTGFVRAAGIELKEYWSRINWNLRDSSGWRYRNAGYGANLQMDPINGNIQFITYNFGQRNATATGQTYMLTLNKNGISVHDSTIKLRSYTDPNHGLGWFGANKPFAGTTVDGPVLFGWSGGALGSKQNSSESIALYWNTSGNVGIGTTNPGTYRLAVNGDMKVKKVVVTQEGWPDFVFADDYKLMPLNLLEKHVKTHKHLPGIPTEKDVTSNGVDLGEVQAKLLQKVEELTLYVIEMNKKIEMQNKKILEQEKVIQDLKK